MTDWFVDASTTTGNGTDPASPFSSLLSISWGDGDRAWMRNTHDEFLTNSQYIGPNSTWNFSSYHRHAFVIGWPQAGMPYYDERPARGVTVGWDADVPATDVYSNYGYKFPKLSGNTSNGFGILMDDGTILANCYLSNSGGSATRVALSTFMDRQGRAISNVMFCVNTAPYSILNFNAPVVTLKKIILCGSRSNGAGIFDVNGIHADVVEIHSKSVAIGGLLATGDNTTGSYIGCLVNYSSSIDQIFNQAGGSNGPGSFIGPHLHIGRITGVRPYSGFVSSMSLGERFVSCDDYFGEGPVMASCQWNWRVGSSGECQYSATNASIYSVKSIAATLQDYRTAGHLLPILRQYVNVASGTKITINVPIYVDSTAVFSPAGGNMFGTLYALGAQQQVISCRSNILPGSYTNWTGSFIAGGSCWLFSCVFTPTETASNVLFTFNPGNYTQASSGLGLIGYTLFGKPEVI